MDFLRKTDLNVPNVIDQLLLREQDVVASSVLILLGLSGTTLLASFAPPGMHDMPAWQA